jgi:hypothetical protein
MSLLLAALTSCRMFRSFHEPVPMVSARENPRRTLTDDPYFTGGLRAVMVFAARPTSPVEIDVRDWELPERRGRVLDR